jgi:predicted nucleotidyltransferase
LNDLILFGSQARGDAEPDSDIDLLVILGGEVNPWAENQRTGQRVSQLCLDYNVVICNIFVSVEQFTAKSSALLRNISNEGVSV